RADHPALRAAAVHHDANSQYADAGAGGGRVAVPPRTRHRAGRVHLRAGHGAVAAEAVRLRPRGGPMKPIYVLNGPNLNRLGTREPEIYGTTTLAESEAMCRAAAGDRPIASHQTNSEEKLIDLVHEAIDEGAAILINPAAYTFTSLALLDALKQFPGPIIELHISNI